MFLRRRGIHRQSATSLHAGCSAQMVPLSKDKQLTADPRSLTTTLRVHLLPPHCSGIARVPPREFLTWTNLAAMPFFSGTLAALIRACYTQEEWNICLMPYLARERRERQMQKSNNAIKSLFIYFIFFNN